MAFDSICIKMDTLASTNIHLYNGAETVVFHGTPHVICEQSNRFTNYIIIKQFIKHLLIDFIKCLRKIHKICKHMTVILCVMIYHLFESGPVECLALKPN